MEDTRLRVNVLVGKQRRGQALRVRPRSRNVALDEPVSVLNAVSLCAQLVMLHLQRLQHMAVIVHEETCLQSTEAHQLPKAMRDAQHASLNQRCVAKQNQLGPVNKKKTNIAHRSHGFLFVFRQHVFMFH